MRPYGSFALVYDQLMRNAPYEAWLEWIEQTIQLYGRSKSVTELGCGTGTIAIRLAQQGFQVTGIDSSPEMLSVAAAKAALARCQIQWVEQDMTAVELPAPASLIVCLCDTLNYVIEEDQVQKMFTHVAANLEEGGLFLFDSHSLYHMEVGFGDQSFGIDDGTVSCVWQCTYEAHKHTVEHELVFYIQEEDGRYERVEEVHRQRAYSLDTLQSWLQQSGLQVRQVTADFSDQAPQEDSERWFIVAQKVT